MENGQQPSAPEDYIEVENKKWEQNRRKQKKKDDSTIVLFNSYLFKLNFCKVPFEQDEQLYRRKREKQYGSSC